MPSQEINMNFNNRVYQNTHGFTLHFVGASTCACQHKIQHNFKGKERQNYGILLPQIVLFWIP